MSKLQFIGPKISYQEKGGGLSVVIAAGMERYKEGLLMAWLFSWVLVGVYFIAQMFQDLNADLKLYIGVLLTFWAYYLYKISSVFVWRKWGYESLRFEEDKLIIRNVVKGLGKPKTFFVGNIDKIEMYDIKDTNFFQALSHSFWNKGNDSLFFESQGKKVSFGKQLIEVERRALWKLLNKELQKRKKKA